MKNKIDEIVKGKTTDLQDRKITRKQAIRKAGYIAVSTATMMILISNPNKAQAASPDPPPGW